MTPLEFSDEFDVLYNNVTSNQAPGLDEYEKSVFLTKALNELVKAYFTPLLNKSLEGFDDSPIRLADFSNIIKFEELEPLVSTYKTFDKRAVAFILPSDLFISLNELLYDGLGPFTVLPISFTEYSRLMSKPYKYPLKYLAWRMITNKISEEVPSSLSDKGFTITNFSDSRLIFKVIAKEMNSGNISDFTPKIDIGGKDVITITCYVPVKLSLELYFSLYILRSSESGRKGWDGKPITNLEPYIGNMEDTSKSLWPTFKPLEEGEILNLDIMPFKSRKEASVAEVIARFRDRQITYSIRYVKKLLPIILTDLSEISNNLSILGYNNSMTCELPEQFHKDILQRAVELAKAAYVGDLNSQIALGLASATDKGFLSSGK